MRKNKHNVTRIFIRGFVLSFFIVIILLGAGILGYQATLKLWMPKTQSVTDGGQSTNDQEGTASSITAMPVTVPSLDAVLKNLIYCCDKKKGTINKLVLEIFHSDKKQLTYITIPLTTQYTMSDTLYRKLILVQPSIPQIIRLSSIANYFDKDTVFDYGTLIVSDLLGLDISYYTAVPVKLYNTIFTEQVDEVQVQNEQADKEQTEPREVSKEVFKEKFLESLGELNNEQKLRAYIEDLYTKVEANLPLSDKLTLLSSYLATPLGNVSFEQLAGEEQNSGFIPDEDKVRQQLFELGAFE